jgi:stearoyl-CoA desaturase (delta-9 desaturase)
MFGQRPFATKDLSRNFVPFSLLSFGEAWHNGHHAFPSSARHGLDRGQLDISARIITIFAKLGLATCVRLPDPERINARRSMSRAFKLEAMELDANKLGANDDYSTNR